MELAGKNVTANALALGYFEHGLIDHIPSHLQAEIKVRTPIKRFGKANEIGGIIKYLLSDDGGFVTGQVFHVYGGIYLC